mgnify:FL=1|jgi:phage shock protein A
MGFFKRITATFAANVDSAIATMENHNAVVEASLKELRVAAAKSKARLRRIAADGARLESKLEQLHRSAEQWTARAMRYANSDEDRALECLRRKQAVIDEHTATEQALERHRTLIAKLTASIERIDARYRELEQTRTVMQSRERAAVATRTVADAQRFAGTIDIDDTLERWEARIAEFEPDDDPAPDALRFEQSVLDEEQRADLRAELDALKQSAEDRS